MIKLAAYIFFIAPYLLGVKTALDIFAQPKSHNLWPLEVTLYFFGALVLTSFIHILLKLKSSVPFG